MNFFFARFHFIPLRAITLVMVAAVFVLVGSTDGYSQSTSSILAEDVPVNFSAKSLTHDDEKQTVTAVGDVELVQGLQILRADKIVYYLAEDRVQATGNVSLLDDRGDVHFAEQVELRNKMKDGFVKELLTLLADGSRFTAQEGVREENGTKITLTNATYTLCKVCEADPKPLWQLKASRIVHDTKTQSVKYKNARLELLGVPLIYSPIFSHPDPTLKRKSGFLRPQYGWTRELGSHFTGGYYYTISPDKDLTVHVMPTSLAGTLVQGEWRQRFEHGKLQINGGTVNSDRKEEDGRVEADKQRGHIFAEGRYDFNDKWRGGLNIAQSSDKEYLRLYDISKENVLTNQLFAERFDGRDYSNISAYSFQDVRLGVRPDQPDIFPIAEHTMFWEPNSFMGGRTKVNLSALALGRDNNFQDVQRGSVMAEWERHGISSGFDNTLRLDARGDIYGVQDSDISKINPALDAFSTSTRGMANASFISSYPLVRTFDKAQAIIEPIAGLSLSPDISQQVDEIPNEDSVDIQFDTNNLFEENRFPGIDRQEDGGRLNYGVKTGLYGDNGRYGKVFLGQSYRFYGGRLFPEGSGLENRHSDTVGQIKVGLSRYLDADYRFQLGSSFDIRRHEIQAGGGNKDIRLNTRYLYTDPVAGTGFIEPREQIQGETIYNLSKTWKWRASGLVDLGDEPGLRNATMGLDYADECFTFSIQGSREVADEASGDDDTKILMRIGLKSIGEFAGPHIPVGGRPQAAAK